MELAASAPALAGSRTAPSRRPRSGKRSMPMVVKLAYRNLFHDRLSFFVTVVGILFSVVLVAVQSGIYLGSANKIAAIIDAAPGGPLGRSAWDQELRRSVVPFGSRALHGVVGAGRRGLRRYARFIRSLAETARRRDHRAPDRHGRRQPEGAARAISSREAGRLSKHRTPSLSTAAISTISASASWMIAPNSTARRSGSWRSPSACARSRLCLSSSLRWTSHGG